MTNPNLDLEALVGAAEKASKFTWDPHYLSVEQDDFCTLANPSTILALASRLMQAEKVVEGLRAGDGVVISRTHYDGILSDRARAAAAEAALTQREEVIRGLREALEQVACPVAGSCAVSLSRIALSALTASRIPPGSDEALQDTGAVDGEGV